MGLALATINISRSSSANSMLAHLLRILVCVLCAVPLGAALARTWALSSLDRTHLEGCADLVVLVNRAPFFQSLGLWPTFEASVVVVLMLSALAA